jgi:hypothetical protein
MTCSPAIRQVTTRATTATDRIRSTTTTTNHKIFYRIIN